MAMKKMLYIFSCCALLVSPCFALGVHGYNLGRYDKYAYGEVPTLERLKTECPGMITHRNETSYELSRSIWEPERKAASVSLLLSKACRTMQWHYGTTLSYQKPLGCFCGGREEHLPVNTVCYVGVENWQEWEEGKYGPNGYLCPIGKCDRLGKCQSVLE
uniref:Putative secreted protein n=1 Tax=Amblyomma americanum TaxID=6943 RepID=A0A0C9SF65_AMBAM